MLFLSLLITNIIAYAQSAPSPAKPGMGEMLFPLVVIMVVFYFLVARPQQKKLKEQQAFITSLKRGDNVLTTSGIFGEIVGITDLFVTLQISENTKIKILKSQIARLAKEETKQ